MRKITCNDFPIAPHEVCSLALCGGGTCAPLVTNFDYSLLHSHAGESDYS